MKKLLIVSDSLRVGGIQRSLENLLNIIDYNKYNVTLFLFHHENNKNSRVNNNVKIISSKRLLKYANMPVKEALENGWKYYIMRKLIATLCLIFGSNLVYKIMFLFENNIHDFDVAVSFSNNINNNSVYFGSNKFILEKTVADKKIAWLHVDYNNMNMNNNMNRNEYERFDSIIHVSRAIKNSFLENYPDMIDKCEVVYNSVDEEKIKSLSKAFVLQKTSHITLVSVGRLDENKSPKSYVNIARLLKMNNIDFHWWILGDGPEKAELLNEIQNSHLSGNMTLLGEVNNPYPYIIGADIFVSASKSESFGLAIAEALCLKTPVVARYYPALKELITDNFNGIISYGNDKLLANSVVNMILNIDMYNRIKENTELLIKNNLICEQFDNLMK